MVYVYPCIKYEFNFMLSPFLILSPLLPIRHKKYSHKKFNMQKVKTFKVSTILTKERSSKRGGHFQQSNQLLEKCMQDE